MARKLSPTGAARSCRMTTQWADQWRGYRVGTARTRARQQRRRSPSNHQEPERTQHLIVMPTDLEGTLPCRAALPRLTRRQKTRPRQQLGDECRPLACGVGDHPHCSHDPVSQFAVWWRAAARSSGPDETVLVRRRNWGASPLEEPLLRPRRVVLCRARCSQRVLQR